MMRAGGSFASTGFFVRPFKRFDSASDAASSEACLRKDSLAVGEVSTESGSDRVATGNLIAVREDGTRSLPLSVLTSSLRTD